MPKENLSAEDAKWLSFAVDPPAASRKTIYSVYSAAEQIVADAATVFGAGSDVHRAASLLYEIAGRAVDREEARQQECDRRFKYTYTSGR